MPAADETTYAFRNARAVQSERLQALEAVLDAGTVQHLDSLGVGGGWRCLEVGAGAGSVAEWLAERVGPDGEVLATDVSTRYLDAIGGPGLEVREHDIRTDPLPERHFDLIHARLVVEHLGRAAVEAMVPALAPGGLLVLEDYDFSSAVVHPENDAMRRVTDAVLGFMSRAGFDPLYGRKLIDELEAVGVEGVEAEGRVRVYRGGTAGTAFSRLSLQSLRPTLVEEGLLAEEDASEALAGLEDAGNTFLSPTMVAAWGRRPL